METTIKKIYLKEIDSTNTFSLKNIVEIEDRTAVIAEMQTQGRGRFRRKWISHVPENMYLSIVLKPSDKLTSDVPYANITQYASVILTRVIESYGVKPMIKWPNDVQVNKKKILGILSEISTSGNKLNGFVLGIGVNLNLDFETIETIDLPATSLNLEIGKPVDKNKFIDNFLTEFFFEYDKFIQKGFSYIRSEYITKSTYLGSKVCVNGKTGIATAINDDGSLVLTDENNHENMIITGDLFIL